MMPEDKLAVARLRDATSPTERYSAIIAIGKAGLTALATEVAAFLHDPEPNLRSAAIRTLGFYWNLPAYRKIAETMIRDEPDERTRSVAVLAWASYDYFKRVPATLKRLYQIVVDDLQPWIVRSNAYDQFFGVYCPDNSDLPKTPSSLDQPFESEVDWPRLDAAMLDTNAGGPDVDAMRETKRIIYRDPLATLKMSAGQFELTCEGRTWDGTLTSTLWETAVGSLELAQFPERAAASERDKFTLTREGVKTESVEVPTESSKYRDITRLANSITGSVVPDLAVSSPIQELKAKLR